MDTISTLMFTFVFLMGFIFSILGLFELKRGFRDREMPIVGLFFNTTATILWFVMALIWPAFATAEAFVTLSWLWLSFGWIFTVTSLCCVFLMLKYAVKNSAKSMFQIEQREQE